MTAKIEDILDYIETRAATIGDLVDHIKVVFPGQPVPDFKDYGLRVYFGLDDWKIVERRKIGPIVTEIYKINVDLVFNRDLTPRNVFSDAKGISYWEDLLMATFINQRNSGMFQDSYWTVNLPMESGTGSIILKGVLRVQLQNLR